MEAIDGISEHAESRPNSKPITDSNTVSDDGYFWRKLPSRYPVKSTRSIPTGTPLALPKIQASFPNESAHDQQIRLQRQKAVLAAFRRSWQSYCERAWMEDELTPISGASRNPFGGWGATLVDSLDTLYIMGMHADFEQAVRAAVTIDFEKSSMDKINVFETTIRYLGGFLSAYDLSGDARLLRKAREVGDMLYAAFDTPNRMPVTRWYPARAAAGEPQVAGEQVLLAEIGSLCMEFTRLSQLTRDPRWFDATERITEVLRAQQHRTLLPGMWPITVNARVANFTGDNTFSLGAMADSAFEYLPKMVALTGGLLPHYRTMYEDAMATAVKHNLWRPMVPDEADILIASNVRVKSNGSAVCPPTLEPVGQHLVCFAGGMLTLGAKLFEIPEHLGYARKLADGCVWTYAATPSGVMPEVFSMVPCPSSSSSAAGAATAAKTTGACRWDEEAWKRAVARVEAERVEAERAGKPAFGNPAARRAKRLPAGFTAIPDARYILRPEAIESLFVLYRATGDGALLDAAWAMFEAIQRHTETAFANAAVVDVTSTRPSQLDSMESFWLGETLKYLYLIFSEPDLVSLDQWVFNTEAHPFRRPVP